MGDTSTGTAVIPSELAEFLRPVVEAHRAESERDRTLAEPILAALRTSGAFRLNLPRELGGHELSVHDTLQVVEQVGRLDGSTAWVLANASLGPLAGVLPEGGTAALWAGGPDTMIVNSTRAGGAMAHAVEGGYRLTGRWDLVSGLSAADWACLLAIVFDGDGPALDANGNPDLRLFCMPTSDLTTEDTWDATAMRGTGSITAVADSVFVPAELAAILTGPPTIDRPLFRISPFHSIGPLVGAGLLGITHSALDELRRVAVTKTTPDGGTPAGQHATQAAVGELAARLSAARLLLLDAAADLDRTAEANQEITLAQRGRLRGAMSHVASTCRAVLVSVYELGGSTMLYRGSRLEQCVRDGLAAAQHGNLARAHFVLAGRIDLGLDPQELIV